MKLIYHPKVLKEDIPQLTPEIAERILNAIENKLMVDPIKFGFFLHGSLHGYKKLRVGDWRIIYQVVDIEVRIIAIGQRKDMMIYKTVIKRI
ncbi:MAG: type II toxin-antitoxin system mRNA interferase toxin, RelE/StbE family [Elusimicrobia bacterium]|nr:type II toxin-antitoxin system mRNA interferase toxin, RelE/StbE family [Elusimicrobiota bacterium]